MSTLRTRLDRLEAGASSGRECSPVLQVPFDGSRPWPEVAEAAIAEANARGEHPRLVVPMAMDADSWERMGGAL